MVFTDIDYGGLAKVAFRRTVGDVINAIGSDFGISPSDRRKAIDEIVRTGLDVKDDATRLLYMLGGGLAGKIVADMVGGGSVLQVVSTVGGAAYANSLYDKSHPDSNRRGRTSFNLY